jgi:uncharacterized membrane protein
MKVNPYKLSVIIVVCLLVVSAVTFITKNFGTMLGFIVMGLMACVIAIIVLSVILAAIWLVDKSDAWDLAHKTK